MSNQQVTVNSSESSVVRAMQSTHDANITASPSSRLANKALYFKQLRELSQVRLAKGMQFLRVKDADLITDKLNLISDIHAISDDEFSRSNLCPVLNQVGERDEPLDPDMRELEEFQHLSALLAG